MRSSFFRRSLLLKCLSLSLFIHVAVLFYIFRHPLSHIIPIASNWYKTPTIKSLEDKPLVLSDINRALAESFKEIVALKEKEPSKDPEHLQLAQAPAEEKKEESVISESEFQGHFEDWDFSSLPAPSFSPFALEPFDEAGSSYELESKSSLHFEKIMAATSSSKEEVLPSEQPELSPTQIPSSSLSSYAPSIKEWPQLEMTDEKDKLDMITIPHKELSSHRPTFVMTNSIDFIREEWLAQSRADLRLPDIASYGVLDHVDNFSWEENIDIEVSFLPDRETNKYVVSFAIKPEFSADYNSLKQTFYFVIDRSSSIEQARFNNFKRAVQRALSGLREGDFFNIIIVDKKLSRLSERPLAVSVKNIQRATEYLDQTQYKTLFSSGDLYAAFDKLFPSSLPSDQLHTIILLSDGQSILKPSKQQNLLTKCREKNLSVYTAAAGQGNQLVHLDLLSVCTGGKLLYSDTHTAFPRKLVKLVKDLHDPVVKDITVEVTAHDPENEVVIHHPSISHSALYARQPYTIIGTLSELSNVTVFLQGRNGEQWYNVKKTISFKDAQKGGRSLEKLWATQEAHLCYHRFLKDGKTTNLKEAQKILAPYRAVICLDQ